MEMLLLVADGFMVRPDEAELFCGCGGRKGSVKSLSMESAMELKREALLPELGTRVRVLGSVEI